MATAPVVQEIRINVPVPEPCFEEGENLNNLAKKCIEIAHTIYRYDQQVAAYEKQTFKGKTFKAWFSENVKHIVKFRSQFPSVKKPGSHEKLTLTLPSFPLNAFSPPETREWGWEEFVEERMFITLQYLNRLLDEYAPETKPAKPPKAKKVYTTDDGLPADMRKRERALKSQRNEAQRQVKELEKKLGEQGKKLETCRNGAAGAAILNEHSGRDAAVAYFRRLGGVRSVVHEMEQILKALGHQSKVTITVDEEGE